MNVTVLEDQIKHCHRRQPGQRGLRQPQDGHQVKIPNPMYYIP